MGFPQSHFGDVRLREQQGMIVRCFDFVDSSELGWLGRGGEEGMTDCSRATRTTGDWSNGSEFW